MGIVGKLGLEDIVAGIPGGFFIYRAYGEEEIIYSNHEIWDIYNCSSEEEFNQLTGNKFSGMVHPEDFQRVEKSIWEQIREERKKFDYVEYRIITKDGQIRWVEDFGQLVENDVYGDIFYVFVSDITDKMLHDMQKQEQY